MLQVVEPRSRGDHDHRLLLFSHTLEKVPSHGDEHLVKDWRELGVDRALSQDVILMDILQILQDGPSYTGHRSNREFLDDHAIRPEVYWELFHLCPISKALLVKAAIWRKSSIVRSCRSAIACNAPYKSASSQWMRIFAPCFSASRSSSSSS